METISRNTEAVLLLTAPLILKKSDPDARLLVPREYNKVALALKEQGAQPADLLGPDAAELIRICEQALGDVPVGPLLGRGFRLAGAVEGWQARSLWVYSRSDPEYPERLKQRLKQQAPPVLYGCGRLSLLEDAGFAIVGSRSVSEELLAFTATYGRRAAEAGYTVVSGGAKGVDRKAMEAALEAGGSAAGVMADSLQRLSLSANTREPLADGRLVLLSPVDPQAGFNVGIAMARNKLIYGLADAALIVSAEQGKGGTWTGAVEQLKRPDHIPLYVRRPTPIDHGLTALVQEGAAVWSDPSSPDEFRALLSTPVPKPMRAEQAAFVFD
jgi:predicted Rossmann fold nucleotide-binding protein DprA/Smf involved in DNA uptake